MNISYPIIIDGGLSNELEAQGCDLNHDLWTAHLLETDIESIIRVHLKYLRAGAQCISTCSYQASILGLVQNGYTFAAAKDLIIKSVWAASEAKRIFHLENEKSKEVYIAASIGPYGAYLADGSEYKGNYGISKESLKEFHAQRIEILDNSDADILAFETFPDYNEAEVIYELTQNVKKPCWISFSCRDDRHISDGTLISKCAELFADHPNIFAVGVNCLSGELVSGLIIALKSKSKDKKIIVYPNSGGQYDSQGKKWQSSEEAYSLKNHAQEWIALGADMIGGCCKIGAKEIGELSESMA